MQLFAHRTKIVATIERPRAPIVAFTSDNKAYYRLNLIWGVKPILLQTSITSMDDVTQYVEETLYQRGMASSGDKVLIIGGTPIQTAKTTDFLKIYTLQ